MVRTWRGGNRGGSSGQQAPPPRVPTTESEIVWNYTVEGTRRRNLPPPTPGYGITPLTLPNVNRVPFYDANFEKLNLKLIERSMFCDREALEGLGIFGEVERLMTASGWATFVDFVEPTCRDLYFEFLMTFTIAASPVVPGRFMWRFRLLDEYFAIDEDEVCDWMGWSQPDVSFVGNHELVSAHEAYRAVTGQPGVFYDSNRGNASDIANNAILYIHRVLLYMLLGGKVTAAQLGRCDMTVVYWILSGARVDWAQVFRRRFEWFRGRRGDGVTIRGGAIATRLARRLGILHADSILRFLDYIPAGTVAQGEAVSRVGFDLLVHAQVIRQIRIEGVPGWEWIPRVFRVVRSRAQPKRARIEGATHADGDDGDGASGSGHAGQQGPFPDFDALTARLDQFELQQQTFQTTVTGRVDQMHEQQQSFQTYVGDQFDALGGMMGQLLGHFGYPSAPMQTFQQWRQQQEGQDPPPTPPTDQ